MNNKIVLRGAKVKDWSQEDLLKLCEILLKGGYTVSIKDGKTDGGAKYKYVECGREK
ncbi:MAG: hypothetical protein J5958_06665 [Clostridia bacterium]|nr:hypothetical protein [Clostridia bacterium]